MVLEVMAALPSTANAHVMNHARRTTVPCLLPVHLLKESIYAVRSSRPDSLSTAH